MQRRGPLRLARQRWLGVDGTDEASVVGRPRHKTFLVVAVATLVHEKPESAV